MTTFQDPPPQSRRAVRQSERGELPTESATESRPYSFDPNSGHSTTGEIPAGPATGRRAAQPASGNPILQPEGFEPLDYTTQGSQAIIHRETPTPVQHNLVEPPAPDTEHQGYRVRDYSPEGRRSVINRELAQGLAQPAGQPSIQPSSQPSAAPAAVTPPPPSHLSGSSIDLDYHTQVLGDGRASGSHSAAVPVVEDDVMNHTLTRRELRELRAAQEEPHPLQMPEPIDALLNSGPIELPVLSVVPGQSQALAEAMAEFDLLTRARREAEAKTLLEQAAAAAAQAAHHVQPHASHVLPRSAADISDLASAPAPATAPVPLAPPAAVTAESQLAAPPELVIPLATPHWSDLEPRATEPRATEPVDAASQTANPVPSAVQAPPSALVDPVFIEPERAPSTKPVGHWSVQAELDDEEQTFENTQTRTVGGGSVAVTTSALVLPVIPQATDITSPFTATGEIMVTGSIDLPRSLSSTGAHPSRVDNSDFEDDPLDNEIVSADSAPVRAIRAVSTHTSTRGVIETRRPQTNRLSTVMIVATCVLAVAVATLLVMAAVQHLF